MNRKTKLRVIVLGAGFGGLELSAVLSERLKDDLDLTLIDRNEFFFFGYSKLDVMFGKKSALSVKHFYRTLRIPGITFRQETITSIDPVTRRVTTGGNVYQADVLVIALGADYDIPATEGLAEGGFEFYSFEGAERAGDALSLFEKGHVLVGVTGFPFKCPPAPSETALMLHEYLNRRGIRDHCEISLVLPWELPVPPSYGTSKALLKAFQQKNIRYIPEMMVQTIDPVRKRASLDDGREVPFDLFLGIPEHCVPGVVAESGLVFDGWIPVDRKNLKTKFPGVYAIGDATSVGTPKAGMFAMGAARTAAECIAAEYKGQEYTEGYSGSGSCYVEFGEGKVGRADVTFFPDPAYPTGSHRPASASIAEEKRKLEEVSRTRWFG